jgi:menaquinone-specific isochorismate synthase
MRTTKTATAKAPVAPGGPRPLVARTVRLPAGVEPDLVAIGGGAGGVLWQREGFGLAGRGAALRIDLPGGLGDATAVAEVLRSIPVDDEVGRPGCGPVALGALPFDPGAPGGLVVPATLVGRDADGSAWLTTVSEGAPAPELASIRDLAALPDVEPPDAFSLVPGRAHAEWCSMIADAVSAIRAGELDKVVLAREVLVEANRELVPADVLRRLRALYPSCMVFATGGFVGASPELLVSRIGREVTSHPLAGTIPHSGDPVADGQAAAALLASTKEREEHRFVVDAVAAVLRPLCEDLEQPEVPSVLSLRNVSHLGTRLRGRLAGSDPPSALDLVARLHPTPAVSGTPNDAALAYLRRAEGFARGRYAGPVGWMDRAGDGAWAVGIRSAELDGRRARLFAGVGVVAASDPRSELAETQLKLQALLAAVVRP